MKKTILFSLVMVFLMMTSTFRSYATDTTRVKTTDSTAYIKLTPQQYEDLVRAKIENEADNDKGNKAFIDNHPIFKRVLTFLFVISIVVVISVSRYFRQKRMQELQMKYLEAGKEMPTDVKKIHRQFRNNPLERAIVYIMVGIGIMVSMYFIVPSEVENIWTMGLIPLFVGLGFLIVHFFEKKS